MMIVVGAHKNRLSLGEAILISSNNIDFYEDLTKLSFNYHQTSSNTYLIFSSVCNSDTLKSNCFYCGTVVYRGIHFFLFLLIIKTILKHLHIFTAFKSEDIA